MVYSPGFTIPHLRGRAMYLSPKHVFRLVALALALLVQGNVTEAQQQGPPPKYFGERFVIKAMAELGAAEATYAATTGAGNYGSLEQLRAAGLIDAALASGNKYGYSFHLNPSANTYTARATPIIYRKSGLRSYYIDQRGILFGADLGGMPANDTNAQYIDTCALWGISDNERCTISALRTLHSAQMTYAATLGGGSYAGLFGVLRTAGLIDTVLSTASKHGYTFRMEAIAGPTPGFRIWAVPQTYIATGTRSFFIDVSGVVRGADRQGGDAGDSDPPVN